MTGLIFKIHRIGEILLNDEKKDVRIAYLLLLLTGIFGGHRFYTQKWYKGLIYLILFWIMIIFSFGYLLSGIVVYEIITLPIKLMLANNEIDSTGNLKDEIITFYKGAKYKKELDELKSKVDESGLSNILNVKDEEKEVQTSLKLAKEKQNKLRHEIRELDLTYKELRIEDKKHKEIERLNYNIQVLREQSIYWQEILEEESMGIFTRPEELYPSEYYKEELKLNRKEQGQMKRDKTATIAKEWTVNGSIREGNKIMDSNIKQILRAFDHEVDVLIKTLTFKNFRSKLNAINKSYEQLNKINSSNGVKITNEYLRLKEEELKLAYKGLVKTEEEKELLKEEKEREREEKIALKEIEKKKAVVDKDISHYNNMLEELSLQVEALKDENKRLELKREIESLENKKEEKEKEKESLDFREKNAKAGYVYIISNVGSFGENIVKIGVTRRLDPLERIRELSSASVPFKFDVHAIVFSEDAFKLESSLHKKFDSRRVNLVNSRKEFFHATIDDVKEALKEHKNLTINFNEKYEALEYRDTLKMRSKEEVNV